VPKYPVRRFLCTSDEEEFRDLDQDTAATSAWFVRPRHGVDASSRESYELLEFTIDGESRPMRRSQKSDGQTYTVTVGDEVVARAQPVTMSYTFRTVAAVEGHFLQLRVDQPTKGLTVALDYDETGLDVLRVLDFTASSTRSHVSTSPTGVEEKRIIMQCEGWLLARSGVVFIW
jgi:hypothetical protein